MSLGLNRAWLLFIFCFSIPAEAAPEEKIVDGVHYHILRTQPETIRIISTDGAGRPLRTFPEVARYLANENLSVCSLINGGIFEPNGVPTGLLIQSGKKVTPVNRARGRGNFFLKPNGIFLISHKGAAIIDTEQFPLQGVEILQAVQSGPLLLHQGRIHPAFRANSPSRLHRNGVGVSTDGLVYFAISDIDSPKFPNLYEFAQLFLSLGCNDALFLDGDLSQMRSGSDIYKASNNFGSVIAVIRTNKVTHNVSSTVKP